VKLSMAAVTTNGVKPSWADDVDELDDFKPSDTIDANGIRTIIEYTTNENGKRVKVRSRSRVHEG